jgi:hypothetical protein
MKEFREVIEVLVTCDEATNAASAAAENESSSETQSGSLI